MRRAWIFLLPTVGLAVFAVLSSAIYSINMYHATDFVTKIHPITAPMQALDTAPAFVKAEWNCTDTKALGDAWRYGREAKASSADTISFYNVMRASDENAGYLGAVYGSYSNASSALERAVSSSLNVFNSLLLTVYGDAAELDRLGADRQEYSGEARRYWSEFREIDRKIGEWRKDSAYAARVSAYGDIGSKTVRILQEHSELVRLGTTTYASDTHPIISVYNDILGYYSDSLLKSVCTFHSNARSSINAMHGGYQEQVRAAEQKRAELSRRAEALEPGIGMVTMQVANAITSSSPARLRAVPNQASAPNSMHSRVLFALDGAEQGVMDARTIYSRKSEDYAYLAIERLDSTNALLREQESSLSALDSQLGFLYGSAKDGYAELLEKMRGSMQVYEYGKALEYGASAERANRNRAIYDYSRAISLLRSITDNSSASPDFDYARDVLESMQAAGIDVSYEKRRLSQLSSLGNGTAVYSEIESLLDRLRRRAEPLLSEAERLRESAGAALLTAERWLADPVLSRGLDASRLRQMRLDYEAALSEDPLPGLHRRLTVFGSIRDSLMLKISALASEFLERNAVLLYYPLEVPVCNAAVPMRLLVEVQNPSLVELRGVSLAIDRRSPLTVDYLAPGQSKAFEFAESAVAASCETGATRSLSADEDYAEWSIEKALRLHVPIGLLRVNVSVPGTVLSAYSDSGEASLSNGIIEVKNPANGTLTITYRTRSALNVARSLTSQPRGDSIQYSLELSVRNNGAALENVRLRHSAPGASNITSDSRFALQADYIVFGVPFLDFGETRKIRASYLVENVSAQAARVIGEIGSALAGTNSTALRSRYSGITDSYEAGNYEAVLRLGGGLLEDIRSEKEKSAFEGSYSLMENEFSSLETGIVAELAELRSYGKDTRAYEEKYAQARLLRTEAEAHLAANPALALERMGRALEALRRASPSDALFSLKSASDVEYEKALMNLGADVALVCSLGGCGTLQGDYAAARSAWKNGERTDFGRLRAGLEKASGPILASFRGDFGSEYSLLKQFQKAVDEGVGFNHSIALAYRESDYSEMKRELDALRELSEEARDGNASLGKLAEKYPLSFLRGFTESRASIAERLNSSIAELKSTARTRLTSAHDAYKEAFNKEELSPALKGALDAYESGHYNRAIILSQKVRYGASVESVGSFPWEYAVALVAIAGAAAFALRRPQKPKKRFILRPYGEF